MHACNERPATRIPAFATASRRSATLPAAVLAAVLAAGAFAPAAPARAVEETPFKVAKIYFETNASACDLGIQIVFDTEGIKVGKFKDPNGRTIHEVRASAGLRDIGGQTEGFLEGVEPVILDLVMAAGAVCDPDPEDLAEAITLDDVRDMFPAGFYEFEGRSGDGEVFDDEALLTYDVPAGPVLGSPDGAAGVSPDFPLDITWDAVTLTIPGILPGGARAPVDIVGYQVLVFDGNAGEAPPEFNVVVPGTATSVTVPPQFLEANTDYEIEVLAIETSGNQTITEGSFSTGGS